MSHVPLIGSVPAEPAPLPDGTPYQWSAVLRDGREIHRGTLTDAMGNPILSPAKVPSNMAAKFKFLPRYPAWKGAEIDLKEGMDLDYKMIRQMTSTRPDLSPDQVRAMVNAAGNTTEAVQIGVKKAGTREIVERYFFFPNGDVVKFMGEYEALETHRQIQAQTLRQNNQSG